MTDDTRNFALRNEDGTETSVLSGKYPRQAALKAARREIEPAHSEAHAQDNTVTLRLREHGTDKVHVYEGWSWTEETTEAHPDWLGDTIKESNVSKEGVEEVDER